MRIKRITRLLEFLRYAYDFAEFTANAIANQLSIIIKCQLQNLISVIKLAMLIGFCKA